nr:integrase, catalytic region, zinc finger, CCHC-type, peptidase aspartic, catalytic [Tanacetum cinerariifolium]
MANLSEDIQCKDNEVNILKSIDEGPYKLETFRETLAESTEGTPQFGPERPHVYFDLNSEEKDRYNADIRATNILLQWLPKDIYTLINHYTDVKDIWDNVKMLFDGSELTKEDRESQLYDDFEHFRQHEEESIHDYYVSKLVSILKKHKEAFAWKTTDIPGICPSFGKHKIQLLDDKKPVVQKQRRLNPNIREVFKKEIVKLLDIGIIYPIADSPWEKCHFMVKERIVLGHKVSSAGLEVDKAKIDVNLKLPSPNIKGVRSFLRHAGFY